jgi:hydroxyquinol 1,2-dioxygenase
MIIETEQDVTKAVLSELEGASDPRFKEIMSALVRHLHAFAREVKLTEAEFQKAISYIVALGQHTNERHNEAVLMSGSLGFSMLVCLINNNAGHERVDTTANLLGPFWRMHSPPTENGASIVRSPTPGDPLFVSARVVDQDGAPIAGAEVDVWHSSPEGLYEQQDEKQAEMNLRGKFTTDADGRFGFRTVLPAGYPIPIDGPTGELLAAQGRHNMRPAHIHFLIYKPGHKTLISQVYVKGAPYIDTDVQFGVTEALVGDYVRHEPDEPAPADDVDGPWYSLEKTFAMLTGEARLPVPPIK